jgi:hypothetical protein
MGGFDEKDKYIVRSTAGAGEEFPNILQRRIQRRGLLKTAAIGSALTLATKVTAGVASAQNQVVEPTQSPSNFVAVTPTAPEVDDVVVPEGYYAVTLLRWGEPLTAGAPQHNVWNQTPEDQAQQFGYNCDFVGYLPLPYGSGNSNRGLLCVNHEYTNEEMMFPNYEFGNPTRTQVDVAIEAHGHSVVEIVRQPDGRWTYVQDSPYNRRITGTSPMAMSGPAAGHPWLETIAEGTMVRGTLNNCAGGKTPWGTILTAEENFHQYFSNLSTLALADPRYEVHDRYGMPTLESERAWEVYHDRFDVTREPNEAFRFGWMVELDPYDPTMTPVKRTALGRFRHEAATIMIAPSGQVVAYMGDDARFEYVYKFVSNGTYNPDDRAANMNLLDDGVLYVAKYNDDGSGEWMPLIYGEGPLTEANGFTSQGDVLIKTRLAGDLLGATKMDRPEDVEGNPVNKHIYVMLTNNTRREADEVDAANPRPENAMGHVVEMIETNNDHAATTFSWEMFILAGDPAVDESVFFAGFDPAQVSPIANPDNCAFDNAGNLWITTDGQARTIKYNDGAFIVPTAGSQRGNNQQFFSSVAGSEVCGPEFTPDNRTLFLAIQHPGEGGTFEEPISTWPDRVGLPRPSVIFITAYDNRPIAG